MQKLSVPYRKGHLVMSLAEAEDLAEELTREIESARKALTTLEPPAVVDGYIDVDSFNRFFAQVYLTPDKLRNQSGKLFGRLVAVTIYDGVDFKVICKACGRHVREKCEATSFLHRPQTELFKIEVASLKQHANEFMTGEFRLVGPDMRNNFKLILDHL